MSDSVISAQTQTVGKNVAYVNITLPSGTGNGSTLASLIAAGTDGATAATFATAQYNRIIAVAIRGHSASYRYGGGSTLTYQPITVAVGTDRSEPAENFHLDTYAANVVTGTSTAVAVCILK